MRSPFDDGRLEGRKGEKGISWPRRAPAAYYKEEKKKKGDIFLRAGGRDKENKKKREKERPLSSLIFPVRLSGKIERKGERVLRVSRNSLPRAVD